MGFSLTGFQNLIKKPNLPNSLASIKKHEDWPRMMEIRKKQRLMRDSYS